MTSILCFSQILLNTSIPKQSFLNSPALPLGHCRLHSACVPHLPSDPNLPTPPSLPPSALLNPPHQLSLVVTLRPFRNPSFFSPWHPSLLQLSKYHFSSHGIPLYHPVATSLLLLNTLANASNSIRRATPLSCCIPNPAWSPPFSFQERCKTGAYRNTYKLISVSMIVTMSPDRNFRQCHAHDKGMSRPGTPNVLRSCFKGIPKFKHCDINPINVGY